MSGVVVVGAPTDRFRAIAAPGFTVTPGFGGVVDALGVGGQAFVPADDGIAAVADGNRSAVFPDRVVRWDGRDWALSAKGVGARTPLYGPHAHEVGAERRSFTRESWLGEAPWGAQGVSNARQAADVSAMAARGDLPGVSLCPTIAVARLPDDVVGDSFWYRRHRALYVQELRLMPSNVRLYHGSDLALGPMPEATLQAFGVRDAADLDAFADRYAASGIALLTVFARSMRPCPWGFLGLWYDDVWLDKDAVVASDGTLCFADLEGLEWALAGADRSIDDRVREQFERKLYEFLFGFDALVRVGEQLAGERRTDAERRANLALRLEIALDTDPIARAERVTDGLDLVITPPASPDQTVRLRLIDLN